MARLRHVVWFAVASFLVGGFSAAQVQHQENHPPQTTTSYIKALEDPSREEWQQPDRVIETLGLKPGDQMADLGAGPGYFTLRFARAVGPTGKVYGVDISREMLEYLGRQAKSERLTNIQPVLADPHNPRLPPASVDVIFICDTLHHISDRATYFPLLMRALRPGGRLVNIDFYRRPLPVGPPVEMKIPKVEMIREAESAGFHLVQQYDFLEYQYFVVFSR